jgi:heme A synthase
MQRERQADSTRFARFAWFTLAANLLVIVWGAFVRASGAGAGCGSHWPLCNGAIVPRAPAIATLIEYGHRLSSGVALLLVIALLLGARRVFPPRHQARRAAAASLFFIIAEALIGAGLVLLELVAQNSSAARGFWVAGHLLNTFLLVAALALTAWWADGNPALRWRPLGTLHALLAAAISGVLILGISGAITALGDTLFPVSSLAEGKALTFSSSAHVFVRLRVWHPVLALAVAAALAAAIAQVLARSPTPTNRRLATALGATYALQLVIGLLNVQLLAPIPVQLLHLLLSDILWVLLVLMAASALATPSLTGAPAALGQPLPARPSH